VVSAAICMSGTYDLRKFLSGSITPEFAATSPLHFVPQLAEDGPQLAALRRRFVVLTHGQGRWESPEESWRVADVLGKRGIPNRVDAWGKEWDHDWVTWRAMLPKYLDELLG
jgi:esterase/lipase superfamily enzyme